MVVWKRENIVVFLLLILFPFPSFWLMCVLAGLPIAWQTIYFCPWIWSQGWGHESGGLSRTESFHFPICPDPWGSEQVPSAFLPFLERRLCVLSGG